MNPLLNPQHLMFLLGGAVFLISALLVGVYLLQKSLGRRLKSSDPKPARVRMDDEASFTLETVKGVIAQLKSDEKTMQERLAAAERRADANARKFELLGREIDYGLLIFDAEGFISFSNPQARRLLGVDTWSRRRYAEIFHDLPDLALIIGDCFEAGTESRKKTVEFPCSDGEKRHLEVSILPTRNRAGSLEAVACLVRESALPPPDP